MSDRGWSPERVRGLPCTYGPYKYEGQIVTPRAPPEVATDVVDVLEDGLAACGSERDTEVTA